MAITYRNPDDTNDYLHSYPLCVFNVARSDSPAAPYPALTAGSYVVAGSGFGQWFHETNAEVRTTNMVWDRTRGVFRKEHRNEPYHNIVWDEDEDKAVHWLGEWYYPVLFPPENLDPNWQDELPHIRWKPGEDFANSEGPFLTTCQPFTDWSRSVIRTTGNHSLGAITAEATVHNCGPAQGPGIVFSFWPESPEPSTDDAGDQIDNHSEVHYSSDTYGLSPQGCYLCQWDDIPYDAPHITIEFRGLRIFIVFPYRLIDDDGTYPEKAVPGFIRTSWNLRNLIGKEFEIGKSDLVLMNQKDALKAWPRLDIGITELANSLAVILDESFGESRGKARRSAEASTHTHLLEPWTVLTNVAQEAMKGGPPFRIQGNEFSTDPRSVFVPGGDYIALHSRLANYKMSMGAYKYEKGCTLEGIIAWDNRRTDLDTWPSRTTIIGAVGPQQQSDDVPGAVYSPDRTIVFEWEEDDDGNKTGNVLWTISLSDRPSSFDRFHPWREDWGAAIQGWYMTPEKWWTEAGQITYRDYGQVLEKVTVTAGDRLGPSIVDATITIPLHHLEDHPTLKDTWRGELVDFAPVEIWLGWISNTDTYTPASDNITADLAPRLSGYIHSVEIIGEGEGIGRTVVVRCRDELMRTQKPAGGIDTTFPPMDLLPDLIDHTSGSRYGANAKGYMAVQWLLQRAVGNVYSLAEHPYARYDYTTGFYDEHQNFFGHLPIIRGNAATRSGSMAWPPPYGRDVWSWLGKISEYDAALLFWKPLPVTVASGYIKGATDGKWRSRIHYANWQYHIYQDTHSAFTFYPYVSGASVAWNMLTRNNRIIRETDKRRPEEAINRVVVQAEREGTPWPYLEWVATDWEALQSPEAGGERWFGGSLNTKFVSLPSSMAMGTHGSHPGEITCLMLAHMLFTRTNSQMDVTVPGQPYLWWGDRVYIPANDPIRDPDTTLAYRVIRFTDEATFKETDLSYTTEVTISEEPEYFNA